MKPGYQYWRDFLVPIGGYTKYLVDVEGTIHAVEKQGRVYKLPDLDNPINVIAEDKGFAISPYGEINWKP